MEECRRYLDLGQLGSWRSFLTDGGCGSGDMLVPVVPSSVEQVFVEGGIRQLSKLGRLELEYLRFIAVGRGKECVNRKLRHSISP